MDQKAVFLKFWEKEAPATRKVISRIPEGSERGRIQSAHGARDCVADRAGRGRARRRLRERGARLGRDSGAGDDRRNPRGTTATTMWAPGTCAMLQSPGGMGSCRSGSRGRGFRPPGTIRRGASST